jgi:predicted transcriptional regulator
MTTKDKVLEALGLNGPAKVAVIVRRTELGETTVRKMLKELVDGGEAIRLESGLFHLPPQAAEKPAEPKVRQPGQKDKETQQRDDEVLLVLQRNGQMSREEIAEKLNTTSSLAYLSLYRLRRDGLVKQIHIGTRTPDWAVV